MPTIHPRDTGRQFQELNPFSAHLSAPETQLPSKSDTRRSFRRKCADKPTILVRSVVGALLDGCGQPESQLHGASFPAKSLTGPIFRPNNAAAASLSRALASNNNDFEDQHGARDPIKGRSARTTNYLYLNLPEGVCAFFHVSVLVTGLWEKARTLFYCANQASRLCDMRPRELPVARVAPFRVASAACELCSCQT